MTGIRATCAPRVQKLRRKFGDDATSPARVFTERGVGYRRPLPDEP